MAFMTTAQRTAVERVRNALRDSPIEHPMPENQVKELARAATVQFGYGQMALEEALRDQPITTLLTGILMMDDVLGVI